MRFPEQSPELKLCNGRKTCRTYGTKRFAMYGQRLVPWYHCKYDSDIASPVTVLPRNMINLEIVAMKLKR